MALAPTSLFNHTYALCVCQEHLLNAHWMGCGVSEKIERGRSIKMLMTDIQKHRLGNLKVFYEPLQRGTRHTEIVTILIFLQEGA